MFISCINDFSSFIQLAATLNIAFVVVEYAKSFTSLLAKNIFEFDALAMKQIQHCHDLIDKSTVDTIESVMIDGKSTESAVQGLKRQSTILTERADALLKDLKLYITSECQIQSTAFISLYLSLFCFLALFYAGIGNEDYICCSWTVFVILSLLLLIVSLIWGEKKQFFSRLSSCLYVFFAILVISIFSGFFYTRLCHLVDFLWGYIILATALIPYANFVFLTILIKFKSQVIKKHICNQTQKLEESCTAFKKDVGDHLAVNRVSVNIAQLSLSGPQSSC